MAEDGQEASPVQYETVNVTDDGGVQKKIIKAGTGDACPQKEDEVMVHYTGTLEDGTKFDSSVDRGDPFKFELGLGRVIKAWDLGVATMRKGEKALLICKPEYAYGAAGSPPKIPPDSTLHFEVELLSFKSGTDVSGDGGVLKTVKQEGSGWKQPYDADEAKVTFTLRLQGSPDPVAASGEEGAEFTVSEGLTLFGTQLRAFSLAVKSMKQGETAHLVIEPRWAFGEAGAPPHVPPGAVLEADVTLVGWKTVSRVTDDGGVVKKVLRDVDNWDRGVAGSTVTLSYTGRLADGTVFEQEEDRAIVTDDEALPEGLDLAVQDMKNGELAEVTLAPRYAFGEAGAVRALSAVPPNATVVYTVEAKDVQKAKSSYEMTDEEKLAHIEALKAKGTAAFKREAWSRAAAKYKEAVGLVHLTDTQPPEHKARLIELKRALHLNLAAAHLKQQDFKGAAKQAGKVLDTDPANVKALYRRAQAHMATQDYLEAEADLKRGLEADPANRDLRALLKKLKAEVAVINQKQKALFARMFTRPAGEPDSQPDDQKSHANGIDTDMQAAEPEQVQEG